MEKKIIYQFIIISFLLICIISAITMYSTKNNSIKASIHNAELISRIVKNDLTSYMVNNNVKQIDSYINSMASIDNVKNLWLVRADSVTNQFGINKNQKPKDEIDKRILKTGEIEYELNKTLLSSTMRITVPYKATFDNGIDCLSCHNATSGDTLGAVSMELDISELKNIGLETIYLIPIIMIVGILLILFIFKNKLEQDKLIFEGISKSLNSSLNGNLKKIS